MILSGRPAPPGARLASVRKLASRATTRTAPRGRGRARDPDRPRRRPSRPR
jgi:hypothetical protein